MQKCYASTGGVRVATTNNISCYSSLEVIITTATEATIIIAIIFGKSNSNNKRQSCTYTA